MPRKGGKRKKSRTHVPPAPANAQVVAQEQADIPRSIVAKLGKTDASVTDLVHDIRRMMEPYTTRNLKERSYNRMKDYVAVAGPLGISHLLVTSQSKSNVNLRVARVPSGPTLHFRISRYILTREVKSQQKRPYESHAAFLTPPVVVLNNFNQAEQEHVKLMRVTFQHLFPTINVKTVHLRECRRVVLFHYNKEDDIVELRHYAIKANPVGISKGIKRIVQSKLPNLGRLQDIAEFLQGSEDGSIAPGASFTGSVSDSEAEDEGSRVTLPDQYIGRGNVKSQMSAMKLVELGPRISLELYKVEQEVNEGDILYHKFVQKSAEEAAANKAKIEGMKKIKEQRRNEQNENVKRKREALELKRKEREERKRRRLEAMETKDGDNEDDNEEEDASEDDDRYDEDADDHDEDDHDGDEDDEGDYDDEDNAEEEEEEEEEEASEGEDNNESDDQE